MMTTAIAASARPLLQPPLDRSANAAFVGEPRLTSPPEFESALRDTDFPNPPVFAHEKRVTVAALINNLVRVTRPHLLRY
jgi:hypothetical protein